MSVGAQETEWEQNVLCIGRLPTVGENSGQISDKNVQGTAIQISDKNVQGTEIQISDKNVQGTEIANQYRLFRLEIETPGRLVDFYRLRRHPVCSLGGRAEV